MIRQDRIYLSGSRRWPTSGSEFVASAGPGLRILGARKLASHSDVPYDVVLQHDRECRECGSKRAMQVGELIGPELASDLEPASTY
jgi:hypothetical protein